MVALLSVRQLTALLYADHHVLQHKSGVPVFSYTRQVFLDWFRGHETSHTPSELTFLS